ncbi:MAG: hypothetical protein EAZ97_10665 [Bacteroidetes bacterium]|nr:MAG: hypothetical protein EAZ97_10665 [Bacteroidota bacterium]
MKNLLILLIFISVQAFGQSELIKKNLLGKRWGLAQLIEIDDQKQDIKIRMRDCSEEFLEILGDRTFISPEMEKDGKWEIINDSMLVFRKDTGKKLRTVAISYLSADSLVLTERFGKNAFVETYNVCKSNDSTYYDNYESFEEFESWGVVAAFQQFDYGNLEVGIGRGKIDLDNNFYAISGNLELAPWNNLYGLSVNAWSEGWLMYGLGAAAHSNFSKVSFGIKPMLGLSTTRLFKKSGWASHIAYSYEVEIGSQKLEKLNRHALTLRIYMPFQRKTKVIRRRYAE